MKYIERLKIMIKEYEEYWEHYSSSPDVDLSRKDSIKDFKKFKVWNKKHLIWKKKLKEKYGYQNLDELKGELKGAEKQLKESRGGK